MFYKTLFATLIALISGVCFAQMPPPQSSSSIQFGSNFLIIGILVCLAGAGYLLHLKKKQENIKPAISILVIGLIAVIISFAL